MAFVGRALIDFLWTGEVYEHWSRFVAMMFLLSLATILVITKVIDFSLNLLADQLAHLRSTEVLVHTSPARSAIGHTM